MRPHEGGVKRLDLEVTDHCNANCVFCPRDDYLKHMGGSLTTMSWGQFQTIIDEVYETYQPGFCNLGVFGEPTLWSHLPDGIGYLQDMGVSTRISTNASLLTPELSIELLEAGLQHIHMSVDEIEKNYFESLRLGLNFETCRDNVVGFWNILKENGYKCKVYIYPVWCPENSDRIKDILAYWRKYSHSCHPSREIPTGPDHRAKPWTQNRVRRMLFPVTKHFGLTPHCYDWMVIRADGTVLPCCLDNMKEQVFGNIYHTHIKQIWEGPIAELFRDTLEQGNLPSLCERCRFKEYFK